MFLAAACNEPPPAAPQYFERVIQPILTSNCAFNQGACHKNDGTGNALGNLDVTSYAAITKRRDVLTTYGSFPLPLLLLKATGSLVPPIPYGGTSSGTTVYLPSQIVHAGGSSLQPDSNAFFELQKWMANGANEDGSVTIPVQQTGSGACTTDIQTVHPDVYALLPTVDITSASFKNFTANVEPLLTKPASSSDRGCAFGTCHSSPQSDFFLACQGSGTDDLSKFNFLEAQAYISTALDQSQILLKPLAPSAGGIGHTGGTFFQSKTDPNWLKIYNWVELNGAPAALTMISDGQKFFNDNVMPIFMQRGCAAEGCHSPGAANDFKLRPGSQGFFSYIELGTNYRIARNDFLMPELPDVRQSRIAKKPVTSIANGGYGIVHRGGPPLETDDGGNTDPTMCPSPWTTASTAFCTFVEWHRIERADLITANQADPMPSGGTLPIIAVTMPPNADRAIDFDTYRPGADLVESNLPLTSALGVVDPTGASGATSLLTNCPGTTATRDVRGPDVSYDTSKVAFAMRTSATDTLDIYEVTLDAAMTCTKVTDGDGMSQNGILKHNFDPMYAPDGTLVFASTRGNATTGPTRTLKYLLPASDLWRMAPTATGYAAPTQMTVLLGDELNPAMMLNGEVTFTAEKATQDFYQLSGRRINWDITDYHPLLAQRSMSPALTGMPEPSVGYQQATDVRELPDRNFAIILSDDGTKGAGGTLATFNRSVGPFQANRTDVTFLKSVTFFDVQATGRAGATKGAYRAPFGLPDGRILVSYAPSVTNLATAADADMRYDLVVFDPVTLARTPVAGLSGGAASVVEAVVVFRRQPRPLFDNVTQLVFGGGIDPTDPTHGKISYPDLSLLGTLLGANLRSGRNVAMMDAATQVVFYKHLPPPSDVATAKGMQTGTEMVYDQTTEIGRAPLASDHSVHVQLPSMTPLILELQDGTGKTVFRMAEEDQLGPGEHISRGVPRTLFDSTCSGCHGSVTGIELDIAINPDALTGASTSLSSDPSKIVPLGP
jgi:hypothetical protein